MAENTRYVYFFGAGATEGNAGMRNILGGKGANLAEMASLVLRLMTAQHSFSLE